MAKHWNILELAMGGMYSGSPTATWGTLLGKMPLQQAQRPKIFGKPCNLIRFMKSNALST